jgi:formate dehydrogenase iron-sulfur subunit
MNNVSRRTFCKTTGAIVLATGLSYAGITDNAASAASVGENAMLIDTRKCTGCRNCIKGCKSWNGHTFEENKFKDAGNGLPRFSANQWIDVVTNGSEPVGNGEEGKPLFTRISCMHCREAACVMVCPVGAINHNGIGAVVIDPQKCIGCNYCIANCTFNVIGFDRAANMARKCTLCTDRVTTGMLPACVQACPTDTLKFGPRNEIVSLVKTGVEEMNKEGNTQAAIYGLQELNGLGMLYILEEGLENSNINYDLPENPSVSSAARAWNIIFKPFRTILVAALAFALWANKGASKIIKSQ